MTDDIVARLRKTPTSWQEAWDRLGEAADEIERLREENDKLHAFYEAETRPNPERVKK